VSPVRRWFIDGCAGERSNRRKPRCVQEFLGGRDRIEGYRKRATGNCSFLAVGMPPTKSTISFESLQRAGPMAIENGRRLSIGLHRRRHFSTPKISEVIACRASRTLRSVRRNILMSMVAFWRTACARQTASRDRGGTRCATRSRSPNPIPVLRRIAVRIAD